MHKHRISQALAEHAGVDRAILGLMLDIDRQRPWAEEEIARAIDTPGDLRESLRRLPVLCRFARIGGFRVHRRFPIRSTEPMQDSRRQCRVEPIWAGSDEPTKHCYVPRS
jgi:hypothetical protein